MVEYLGLMLGELFQAKQSRSEQCCSWGMGLELFHNHLCPQYSGIPLLLSAMKSVLLFDAEVCADVIYKRKNEDSTAKGKGTAIYTE